VQPSSPAKPKKGMEEKQVPAEQLPPLKARDLSKLKAV
jgi:hypothetical protein